VQAGVKSGQSLGEQATTLLQRLITFNTVNPPGDELEAQRFLKDYLEQAGFECELVGAVAERPNLIARLPGAREGKTLCYLCHVDTVLADPDEWSVDPWSGELRDGYVWGRGALDMKGQVACEVAGAAALAGSGWRPASGELLIVVTCDEEAGATIGARWLCANVPEKVRCDWVVNEGAGEIVDIAGRRHYTLCVGEKGVFRFWLETRGRASHASIPGMADNALLRMVEVLAQLDGRQPGYDTYPEVAGALEAVLGHASQDPAAALEEVRSLEPRLAQVMEPMLGVTLSPTMISASHKENVVPSRCSVMVDCRVPPGFGGDHVRRRVTELLGSEQESEYTLRFADEVVGNSSPLQGELLDAVREFVQQQDAGADVIPLVLPGFTDSHWFRKAFPECIAYGFFPQRAMNLFDTTPLVHGADERIAVDDIELAARFFNTLAPRLLG
jgi:acetylornithine deacetylase/succinyl-diaminopimelate desuccinylase-like protein